MSVMCRTVFSKWMFHSLDGKPESPVMVLVEEIGAQADGADPPLEAVAQAEGGVAPRAGVEIVVECERGFSTPFREASR